MGKRGLIAVACAALLAGCGSDGEGTGGPEIGKAKTFELIGLENTPAVPAGEPATLDLRIDKPEGGALTSYASGDGPHTGVHLIMVREDLSRLVHRHPPVDPDGSFTEDVAFPEPGPWQVVADAYPDLGPNTLQNFQLTGKVQVEGDYEPVKLPPFRATARAGGVEFTMRRPKRLRALKPEYVEVDVRDAKGRPAEFGPYFGALAHAIFFREDSLTYFHTHVCGEGVPECASATGGESVTGRTSRPGRLRVGMLLPTAGTWRLFLQARVDGEVVTVPYTLEVRE